MVRRCKLLGGPFSGRYVNLSSTAGHIRLRTRTKGYIEPAAVYGLQRKSGTQAVYSFLGIVETNRPSVEEQEGQKADT